MCRRAAPTGSSAAPSARAPATQIAAALAFYEDNFVSMSGVSFADAELRARELLTYAQRHLPQYVEELEGMAEGAAQPFARLLVPNCAEEFTCPVDAEKDEPPAEGPAAPGPAPVSRGCTAAAVMDSRRLVGHNMDWYVVDRDNNVLFDLTTEDGTRLVTLAGAPYLPILGMNSHGVAYVGNSLYSNDDRAGVPNVFVRRWVLEARSLEEAVARACLPARAHGSNHMLGDRQGRLLGPRDLGHRRRGDETRAAGGAHQPLRGAGDERVRRLPMGRVAPASAAGRGHAP